MLVAPEEALGMRGSIPVGHRTIVTTFQPGLGTFFDKARVGLDQCCTRAPGMIVGGCVHVFAVCACVGGTRGGAQHA